MTRIAQFMGALTAASLVLACQRVPDEPPSRTRSVLERNEATHSVDGAASRCLRPTPEVAPAPVAPGPAPGCPADPEPHARRLPLVTVTVVERGVSVEAELTRTPEESERGLMYRRELPENGGMLFHLSLQQEQVFWMHNTCIPLDMLFVDDDGTIVGLLENVPTLNDEPRSVGCPSSWVLEVNAGWARKHGVRAGQHLRIPPSVR